MRVMGIDPGSRRLGLALVDGSRAAPRALAWRVAMIDTGNWGRRLQEIYTATQAWIATHQPDVAVIEDVFVHRDVRAALKLGQARGVVLLALAQAGLTWTDYAPASIKKAMAGHGRASKDEVRRLVRLQLRLRELPPEDAADALAVAATHLCTGVVRDRLRALV